MKCKKNTKTVAWIAAVLFLAAAVTGCGNDKANTAEPKASVTQEVPEVQEAPESAEQEKERVPAKEIAILHTNDVHCAIDGEIGYAGLVAYEKQLESEGAEVLLVDCGDAIQGGPVGLLSKGEDIVTLMNQAGYDAAIPGNHEFDYGMEQFDKLTSQAEFPYLSANFVDEKTGKPVLAPYLIKEAAGVKIAFVGVTTPLTITSSTPAFFQDDTGEFIYGFMGDQDGSKLYAAVQQAADDARAEGADYVIVLSHLGVGEVTSPYLATKLIENTSGIDVVLDGHSHSTVESERVKNKDGHRVLLSQTGTGLSSVGMLLIDSSGNISTGLIKNITDKNAEMTAAIEEIQLKFEATLAEKVSKTNHLLTVNDPETGERLVRNGETNLGDLCADAYLAAGKTDIAFVNGGGTRADLPVGDITYGDILKVFPYSNGLCTVEATGQEILDALEHSVRMMPEETGAFLQVAGMTFEINLDVKSPVITDENGMFLSIEGERRISNVMISDVPLELSKTYTLTSHSYLLKNGGDGYNMFADNTVMQDEFILDYAALINYLSDEYPGVSEKYDDPYGEGRIASN